MSVSNELFESIKILPDESLENEQVHEKTEGATRQEEV